jgi:heat shock protein HtpX
VAEFPGFPSVSYFPFELFESKKIILTGITFLIIVLYMYIYFRSGKWILKCYGAKKIQRNEKAILYSMLENLSTKASIITPEIYSFEHDIPAMFTVGNLSKSSIAISTSMLKILDELKLEVLMAHEVGHIKKRHVGLNTVTAFLAGLIMLFPNFVTWCSIILGLGKPEDPAPALFRFIATGLVAPPSAILVHLTNPVKKELLADEVAVKITGNPQSLAKTLEFLEDYISLQPVIKTFNPGHFHLFSTHTQKLRGSCSIFIHLFNGHPESRDRTARILSHSTYATNATHSKYTKVPGFFDVKNWKLALTYSFISYMILVFIIIIRTVFTMRSLNFLTFGGICAVYIGSILILIGATAKISYPKVSTE